MICHECHVAHRVEHPAVSQCGLCAAPLCKGHTLEAFQVAMIASQAACHHSPALPPASPSKAMLFPRKSLFSALVSREIAVAC